MTAEPLQPPSTQGAMDVDGHDRREAPAEQSRDMALLNSLGAFYIAYGQLDQARHVLALAHWRNPTDVTTFGLTARLSLKRGDRDRAVSILRMMKRRGELPQRDARLLAQLSRSG